MKKYLDALSSLPAGIQVFGQISLLIDVGAFGSWIVKYWLPMTRFVWDFLFSLVPFFKISLSVSEKDSLTAAAFFLPVVVAALRGKRAEAPASLSLPRRIFWPAVLLSSAAILYAIGRQPVTDLVAMFPVTWDQYWNRFLPGGRSPTLFALVGTIVGVLYLLASRGEPSYATIQLINVLSAIFVTLVALCIIFVIGSFSLFGFIRGTAMLFVLFAVVTSLVCAPSRLIQIGAVVVALFAGGLAWEVAMAIRATIETGV
jgi:hypothetical protein